MTSRFDLCPGDIVCHRFGDYEELEIIEINNGTVCTVRSRTTGETYPILYSFLARLPAECSAA